MTGESTLMHRAHDLVVWVGNRLVVPVGRSLRRLAGRADDESASLVWGVGAVAVAGAVVVGPVPVLALCGLAAARRWMRTGRARRRAAADLRRTLPDAVDLLRLGAEAGLTVHQSVAALATHGVGPMARWAVAVGERTQRGRRLVDALVGTPHDPLAAPLVDALVDAERYGTPLSLALGRVASDVRDLRRRDADARARRLPVQLLAPLVVCALPATVVLAVVPVALVAIDGLAG